MAKDDVVVEGMENALVVTSEGQEADPPPADEKSAEPELEPGDESKDDDSKKAEKDADEVSRRKRKYKRTQDRITTLTHNRDAETDRADQAELESEVWKKRFDATNKDDAPVRGDFKSEAEYFAALDKGQKYKAPVPLKGTAREDRTLLTAVMAKFDDDKEDFKDFDSLVLQSKDLAMTKAMIRGLSAFDNPTAIAYHLGNNIELSKEISELKDVGKITLAFKKIEEELAAGALEDKAEAERKAQEKADAKNPPKKESQAPAPIENLTGGNAGETGKKLEDMSFNEFNAEMDEKAKKGGKSFW